jgi:hypothetical protein
MIEFTNQEIAMLSLVDFGLEEYGVINEELKEKLYNFFENVPIDEANNGDHDQYIITHLTEIPGVGR